MLIKLGRMCPSRAAPPFENQLLEALATAHPHLFLRIEPHLKPVSIPRGTILGGQGDIPKSLYFVESGVVSAIAQSASGESLEVALVGTEGVTGVGWALTRVPPAFSYVAHLPVTAHRLDVAAADTFLRAAQPDVLTCLLLTYAGLRMVQVAQSALCARYHTAVQRLARWLLFTSRRIDSNVLPLTHEFLGQIVGAPRSLVSEAASILRSGGAITYQRGSLVIASAPRLEKYACECFGVLTQRFAAYERQLSRTGSRYRNSRSSRVR